MPTDPIGPYPAWGDADKIVSMDPFGAVVADVFRDEIARGFDIRPTVAVTKAHIDMPEVHRAIAAGRLVADGRILLANGSAVVTKAAIEPVWWLPGVAKRFHCTEADLRRALFEETGGMYPELVTRGDLDVFLPPIGGQTAYVFGDAKDLADPSVTLTARVHDECNGSDVFGSDICTCRPYLTHAIEECIRGAQDGGVGLVVYCRKEGRALGEVTKFLVYNARKRQEGGDPPPIISAHRVRGGRAGHALPGAHARRAALVRRPEDPPSRVDEQHEVRRHRRRRHRSGRARQDPRRPHSGRRARGNGREEGRGLFHGRRSPRRRAPRAHQGPRPVTAAVSASPAAALLSPAAIRERCGNIAAAVTAGQSRRFRIHRDRLDACAERVAAVTRKRYPDLRIPYHSRWRHFEAGGVDRRAGLRSTPHADIDLAVVSVLLDAGAGPAWSYVEPETGKRFTRSEGLGVASFRAFARGDFSAGRDPLRVDAAALAKLDAGKLAAIFEVRDDNPLVGLDGRAALLRRLGAVLDGGRPAALFDTLTEGGRRSVSAASILHALLDLLGPIWLTGSEIDGVPLGDTWQHPHAGGDGQTRGWVPFHKLSQWLAYSLFEPFEWAGVTVTGRDELTALPEYRNGGLLLDTGVLALRNAADAGTAWNVGSELVVEWRALTVALIDELAPRVRALLGVRDLPLACILEGGTWAAGRELAMELRGGRPPLALQSDGTVF